MSGHGESPPHTPESLARAGERVHLRCTHYTLQGKAARRKAGAKGEELQEIAELLSMPH